MSLMNETAVTGREAFTLSQKDKIQNNPIIQNHVHCFMGNEKSFVCGIPSQWWNHQRGMQPWNSVSKITFETSSAIQNEEEAMLSEELYCSITMMSITVIVL